MLCSCSFRFYTRLAPRCEHSMIHLGMLLPLQLCVLSSFQHSPEFFKLILRFLLLVALSIMNLHPAPILLCWFDGWKLLCDIASSHICIVQVALAVEPDVLAMTIPDLVLYFKIARTSKATGELRSNKIPPSSKRIESHLLEASAALRSGLETSVMFHRTVLSIPLSSIDFTLILPNLGLTAPEATRNSPHFSSGKSPAIASGSAVTAAPLS